MTLRADQHINQIHPQRQQPDQYHAQHPLPHSHGTPEQAVHQRTPGGGKQQQVDSLHHHDRIGGIAIQNPIQPVPVGLNTQGKNLGWSQFQNLVQRIIIPFRQRHMRIGQNHLHGNVIQQSSQQNHGNGQQSPGKYRGKLFSIEQIQNGQQHYQCHRHKNVRLINAQGSGQKHASGQPAPLPVPPQPDCSDRQQHRKHIAVQVLKVGGRGRRNGHIDGENSRC